MNLKISQSEKQQILEMHKSVVKNHLWEQTATQPTGQETGQPKIGDCETNKAAFIKYLTDKGFKLIDNKGDAQYYTRDSGDKKIIIYLKNDGTVLFFLGTDVEITDSTIPNGFYDSDFATDEGRTFRSLGSFYGKKYVYEYEKNQSSNRKFCNDPYSKPTNFENSLTKKVIDTLIKKLP